MISCVLSSHDSCARAHAHSLKETELATHYAWRMQHLRANCRAAVHLQSWSSPLQCAIPMQYAPSLPFALHQTHVGGVLNEGHFWDGLIRNVLGSEWLWAVSGWLSVWWPVCSLQISNFTPHWYFCFTMSIEPKSDCNNRDLINMPDALTKRWMPKYCRTCVPFDCQAGINHPLICIASSGDKGDFVVGVADRPRDGTSHWLWVMITDVD